MPTSHSEWGAATDAETVAAAFQSEIKNKIILITGVSPGGIGGATAVALAAHGPRLLITAGRNPDKVQEAIKEINENHPSVACKFLRLDLSSQKSCREAAKEILDSSDVPQI